MLSVQFPTDFRSTQLMRRVIGPLSILAVALLTACATGGGTNAVTGDAAKKAGGQVTTAIPAPAAPLSVSPSPETKVARPASAAPAKGRCKVRPDSVPWAHVSGGCRNGYAHGEGRARSVDGWRSYTGMFVDGAFSGRGTYEWGNDVRYTGEFLDSRRNGTGTLTYADSRSYAGEFKDNAYHGRGTYTDADGSRYHGDFQAGYYHGRGTYTWANGDTYVGEFEANQMSGTGAYSRRNGDRYVGEFRNNQMNGRGAYSWPNGDEYVGEFRDGKMHGNGTYTHADGSKYAGEFRDGKKNGPGVLTTPSEEIAQHWSDGRNVTNESR